MKHCSRCNQDKPEDQFYAKGNRLQAFCKVCFNEYCIERWHQVKINAIKQFGGVCQDCKQEFHPAVFEFHHLDPSQKDYSWTKMRLLSPDKRQAELNKCVMLCANCHRLRHALSS